MINFNAAQWVVTQSKIKFEDSFLVNGITFGLMSLSEENIAAARLLTTSQEIIELAANGGFAIERKRAIESEEFADSLALLWEQESVLAFDDPTIMFSVGEKVCELSGLSDVLVEMILDEEAAEEARAVIENAHGEALDHQKLLDDAANGDTITPDTLLGKLEQAAEDYHAA